MNAAPLRSCGRRLARATWPHSDMFPRFLREQRPGLICSDTGHLTTPLDPRLIEDATITHSESGDTIDLSIVIPTFNARARAHKTAEKLHERFSRTTLCAEILLVDDGSDEHQRPDASLLPEGVRVVQLEGNRGKGYAVRTGLLAASGRVRVFTDVDLPYGSESLLECYQTLIETGADLVHGDRSLPGSRVVSRLRKRRRISSVVFRVAVMTVAGLRQADTQCGLKGLRGDIVSRMLAVLQTDGFAFDVEIFRCAQDSGLIVRPIAVHLVNVDDSTVRLLRDSTTMLRDLMAIRVRSIRGGYRLGAVAERTTGMAVEGFSS